MTVLGEFQTSMRKALSEIYEDWEQLTGLVVCGSHHIDDAEKIIKSIKLARQNDIPALLICFGHQLGAVEYARNVLGIKDATSEEITSEGTLVVKKLPQLNVGLKDGESYWNNFEVVIDWEKPKKFRSYQYHVEYQSSIDKPHPALVEFIDLCKQG